MNTSNIYDKRGLRVGTISEKNNSVNAYNKSGLRVGHYNTQTNVTYDQKGLRCASGNVLSSLIFKNSR